MECPACHAQLTKAKVGWLCLSCGNLLSLRAKKTAEAKAAPAKPAKKPATPPKSKPTTITDVKVKVHRPSATKAK